MDFPREGAGAASAASSAGEERGSGANVSAERAALFGSPSAKTQPKAPAAAAAAASSVAAAAAIAAAASATGKAGKPAAVPSAPPAESGLPSYDEALNDDPVSKGKAGPADTAAATQESGSESEDDGAPPAYSQAREVEVGGARDDEEGTATAVPVERTEDQAEAAEQTEDDTGAAADDGEVKGTAVSPGRHATWFENRSYHFFFSSKVKRLPKIITLLPTTMTFCRQRRGVWR